MESYDQSCQHILLLIIFCRHGKIPTLKTSLIKISELIYYRRYFYPRLDRRFFISQIFSLRLSMSRSPAKVPGDDRINVHGRLYVRLFDYRMPCIMMCTAQHKRLDDLTCNGRNSSLQCQIIAAWHTGTIPDGPEATGDRPVILLP
jgi:hypothetical protein